MIDNDKQRLIMIKIYLGGIQQRINLISGELDGVSDRDIDRILSEKWQVLRKAKNDFVQAILAEEEIAKKVKQ